MRNRRQPGFRQYPKVSIFISAIILHHIYLQKNPIISFISSFIITTIIIAVIAVLYLLSTFNLAGGETLETVESQDLAQLLLTLTIFTGAIIIGKSYRKKNRKSTGSGIIVAALLVAVLATMQFFTNHIYPTKFDREVWLQSKWKPDKMCKTLVKEKTLIGMTRIQVNQLLGEGTEESGNDSEMGSISYLAEHNWTFIILFEKGKVVETKLRLPHLGI